jgi:hypothetical protein
MRKTFVFSVHTIDDARVLPFSAVGYSRFKFGSIAVARAFGYELADRFIEKQLPQLIVNQQFKNPLVVIPSPYGFITTASGVMTNFFIERLNQYLALHNFPVVQTTKIHRNTTYREDYGALNAEQRLALIEKDTFHIDAKFCLNKTLLFLDDIKITGSHEKIVSRTLDTEGVVSDSFFLYFAALTNPKIDPTIENYLNYFSINSLTGVHALIQSGDFTFNTRVVKYILNAPPPDCKAFLMQQSDDFLTNFFNHAIGNSYHEIEVYRENCLFAGRLTGNLIQNIQILSN